jgi:hypothetical protein
MGNRQAAYRINVGGSIEGYLYIQINTEEEVLGNTGHEDYPEGHPRSKRRIALGSEKCPKFLTAILMHGIPQQI